MTKSCLSGTSENAQFRSRAFHCMRVFPTHLPHRPLSFHPPLPLPPPPRRLHLPFALNGLVSITRRAAPRTTRSTRSSSPPSPHTRSTLLKLRASRRRSWPRILSLFFTNVRPLEARGGVHEAVTCSGVKRAWRSTPMWRQTFRCCPSDRTRAPRRPPSLTAPTCWASCPRKFTHVTRRRRRRRPRRRSATRGFAHPCRCRQVRYRRRRAPRAATQLLQSSSRRRLLHRKTSTPASSLSHLVQSRSRFRLPPSPQSPRFMCRTRPRGVHDASSSTAAMLSYSHSRVALLLFSIQFLYACL